MVLPTPLPRHINAPTHAANMMPPAAVVQTQAPAAHVVRLALILIQQQIWDALDDGEPAASLRADEGTLLQLHL